MCIHNWYLEDRGWMLAQLFREAWSWKRNRWFWKIWWWVSGHARGRGTSCLRGSWSEENSMVKTIMMESSTSPLAPRCEPQIFLLCHELCGYTHPCGKGPHRITWETAPDLSLLTKRSKCGGCCCPALLHVILTFTANTTSHRSARVSASPKHKTAPWGPIGKKNQCDLFEKAGRKLGVLPTRPFPRTGRAWEGGLGTGAWWQVCSSATHWGHSKFPPWTAVFPFRFIAILVTQRFPRLGVWLTLCSP